MNFLKKLFKQKDTVAVIMAILFLTKLLGLLKFRVIAGYFGASKELDLFWAAFLLPDTLFNILVAGSINAAVIPVFSDVLYKKGEEKLVKLSIALVTFVLSIFAILSIVLIIYADQFAQLLVSSGFIGDSLNLSTTLNAGDLVLLTKLIRIILLSPILLGISSIITAFLQVHKRFFITTLSSLLYNFGMVVGSMLLVGKLNLGVEGLAWSVVLGSVLHLLIQIPLAYQFIRVHLKITHLSRLKVSYKYYISEVKRIVVLAVPRIIAYVGEQINVIVNTLISFSLTEGALSAYRFALSLHQLPVHIIAGAYAQISLPSFAEAYAKGDLDKLRKLFNTALRKVLFVVLPSVVVLTVLRLPIVRLAYGTGNFDWWDTVVTSWALALLGVSVIGQSVVALSLRALYAIHETRWPLFATLVTVIANIIFSYYFTNFFSHYLDWRPIFAQVTTQIGQGVASGGVSSLSSTLGELWRDLGVWFTTRNVYDASVGGLSLSLSLSFMIEMMLNLYFLNRKIKIFCMDTLVTPVLKMIFNALVMSGFMYFVFRLSDFSLDTTRALSVLIVVLVTSSIGAAVYMLMSFATSVGEATSLASSFGRAYDKTKDIIFKQR